eukprot:CAMPEP_0170551372 /NCGR_PEP_ID=MMETSP0211-20121228/9376_1 /TAXON_ID=311385 /ORGANISM="Pseudokeronopsis sp., Strain OXSARD2" /LENGTH=61 /DNA_ID=CAMNT_0010858493 /DNA_START=779 /DNA_END=964 /DNA_ORIENTATION=+
MNQHEKLQMNQSRRMQIEKKYLEKQLGKEDDVAYGSAMRSSIDNMNLKDIEKQASRKIQAQ